MRRCVICFAYRPLGAVSHCNSSVFGQDLPVSGYTEWRLVAVTGAGQPGIVSVESDCKTRTSDPMMDAQASLRRVVIDQTGLQQWLNSIRSSWSPTGTLSVAYATSSP